MSSLCAIVSGLCIAQTFTIGGTVKDTSGKGISGALVKLLQANKSTITGKGGRFVFKVKKKGKNKLTQVKNLSDGPSPRQPNVAEQIDEVSTAH
jgi:hypothetical protein